ncbi:hypothetical protein JCM19000A_12380 [Silvimonas sp. JCM 19000]
MRWSGAAPRQERLFKACRHVRDLGMPLRVVGPDGDAESHPMRTAACRVAPNWRVSDKNTTLSVAAPAGMLLAIIKP